MGHEYSVERVAVDEPEEGESGTVYEWVIRDINGVIVARTYDKDFADWITHNAGRL